MAIFVSNPTTPAVTPLSNDALDPSVIAPEEGFTEELAAAMQPSVAPADAPAKPPLDNLQEVGKKASDLQILPAEVLKNAVGDANFAFAGQTSASSSMAQDSAASLALADASDVLEQDTTALDLANQLQGAEMAAANLAAQMSAPVVHAPVPAASNSGEVSDALSISPTLGSGQEVDQAPQGPVMGPALLESEQIASAPNVSKSQVAQQLQDSTPAENQTVRMAPVATSQARNDTSVQLDATLKANAVSEVDAQAQQAITAVSFDNIKPVLMKQEGDVKQAVIATQVSPSTEAQLALNPISTLKSETSSAKASIEIEAATATVTAAAATTNATAATAAAHRVNLQNILPSTSAVAKLSDASVVRSLAEPAALPASASQSSSSTQVLASPNQATEKTPVSSETKTESHATQAQESAFNFDAKLAKSDAQLSSKALEGKVSPAAVATANAQGQQTQLTLNSQDPIVQGLSDSKTPETTQSLEDISSSFVSSLVGGPQRPVNTVMDWISMRAQERPAPLIPHEVRLDSGAVQLEIQKMVRQGGGHVVMELTPPDQSKFTIELKLDERGGALLIVEGVSDSTKTRLEQSAPQLREQFQQMGLELQLDMRQQGQSASSSAADFSGSQERGSDANNAGSNGEGDASQILTQREAGANRARETGANQVYLYA